MNKKKLYIFFTYGISAVGGTQMYVAGKAKYLQQRGWQVFIFNNAGSRKSGTVIPYMKQYLYSGGGMKFISLLPYSLRKSIQEQYLNEMLARLGKIPFEEYEIIIESVSPPFCYWAELLAERIGARHFFTCCMESYRSLYMGCEDNLDFFYFKWKRNEIIGGVKPIKYLFNGYKNVTAPLVEIPHTIREMDAVQDVDFNIEKIERLDWNICHIGREGKSYVPWVIDGVAKLARRHPDKKINFIMVGNVFKRKEFINKTFNNLPNVSLTFLGDMVPIPRILFSKIDVVCAISQSARFAADENILTICGSALGVAYKRTPGVLGYDTELQIYGDGTFSYVEALERVLVKRLYDGKKSTLPKLRPAEEYYDKFFDIIVRNASPVKEYCTQRLSQERFRDWRAKFPFDSVTRNSQIILFGETAITKDYRNQIATKPPYCKIMARVDEHPEEFDNTVVGIERLKTKDYDAIVICLLPEQAQAARDKILEVVPDMADKIVYDFQKVPVQGG